MKRRLFVISFVTILLIGLLSFSIPTVHAQDTITIREDGSIFPASAPITTSDNVVYTFTGNAVGGGIVVERDSIMIDGNGYALSGMSIHYGIDLEGRSNVVIFNLTIQYFDEGILLHGSSYCRIIGNTIRENRDDGIDVESASVENTIYGNVIEENGDDGLDFDDESNYNIIHGNDIINNLDEGISLWDCHYNRIYHNNFEGNTRHVESVESKNYWNTHYADGGGNYWSNYTGSDEKSGSRQDVNGQDGIGDTSHRLVEYNRDRYPLMDTYDLPQIPTPRILLPTRLYLTTEENEYCEDETVVVLGHLYQTTDNTRVPGVTLNIWDNDIWGNAAPDTVTTDSSGEYRYTTGYDEDGIKTITVTWDGDNTWSGTMAIKQIGIKNGFLGMCCFIATATFGSAMAPEVQFLRNFRADTVLTTFTGQQFMAVFNAIYYSFSPTVASSIAGNEGIRTVARAVLFPLIRILQVGEWVTQRFAVSPDLGIVTFVLVVSALLSLVYLVPWALLLSAWRRYAIPARVVRLGRDLLLGSVGLLLLAIALQVPVLTMIGGALTVLLAAGLTVMVATRAITQRLLTS
jgi:parallel beta-helix repeat protein